MNFSKTSLLKKLIVNLAAIERQIRCHDEWAKRLGVQPCEVRDEVGYPSITPLLLAHSTTLHAITLLQTEKGKNK